MTPPLVLIVDDNDLNRKLARDVLRSSGLETIEAANAEDAIALARARLPDVILMDLRLPDLDGTEALLRLSDDRATAGIPVIALTALKGAGETLLEAGFSGYIEKPIDVLEFPGLVRSFAGRRGG